MLFVAACAMPHPPPAPPRQTNLALQISRLELTNGLRVVLVRDPRATEVEVTMRYRTGSVDDPAGQEGLAHVVEHLMFQLRPDGAGTTPLMKSINDLTTFFNAYTNWDTTHYMNTARAE